MTRGQRIGHFELLEPVQSSKAAGAWTAFDASTGLLVAMEPLDSVLTRGPLKPEVAVRIARQVLEGLQHLHRAGFVYCDLHPGNILVGDNGGVSSLLRDFSTGTKDVRFFSPEQLSAMKPDALSDIYGVGCVLYAMLTGAPPREDPPKPPSAISPGISPSLDAAVLKALNRLPECRFQSSGEFLSALRPSASGAARYQQLVETKYARGLTPEEHAELQRLDDEMSEAEDGFYEPILQRLSR